MYTTIENGSTSPLDVFLELTFFCKNKLVNGSSSFVKLRVVIKSSKTFHIQDPFS